MHSALHAARLRWKLAEHQTAARDDESRVEDPPELRTYSQSISGRRSSQRTAPSDSRSMATTKSPPKLALTEMPLRKYPYEVPQRRAKSWRSNMVSERRYASSFSISGNTIPTGIDKAIPAAHLPMGIGEYNPPMSANNAQEARLQARLYEIRRRNLIKLRAGYDTDVQFADLLGEPPSYVRRLLQDHAKGRKNLGEGKARKFETKLGLTTGALDQEGGKLQAAPTPSGAGWPFKFPPKIWDALSAAEKRKAEQMFLVLIQGIEGQREDTQETG